MWTVVTSKGCFAHDDYDSAYGEALFQRAIGFAAVVVFCGGAK